MYSATLEIIFLLVLVFSPGTSHARKFGVNSGRRGVRPTVPTSKNDPIPLSRERIPWSSTGLQGWIEDEHEESATEEAVFATKPTGVVVRSSKNLGSDSFNQEHHFGEHIPYASGVFSIESDAEK